MIFVSSPSVLCVLGIFFNTSLKFISSDIGEGDIFNHPLHQVVLTRHLTRDMTLDPLAHFPKLLIPCFKEAFSVEGSKGL